MAEIGLKKLILDDTTTTGKLLGVVAFMSIIAQAPILQTSLPFPPRYVAFAFWGLLLAYIILYRPIKNIKLPLTIIAFSIIYVMYVLLGSFLSKIDFLDSTILYSYFVSVFIFFVAYFTAQDLNKKDFRLLSLLIFIATIFFTLNVYFTNLQEVDFTSRGYEYAQKNTAGMIVLTGAVFGAVFEANSKNMIWKIFSIIMVIFMVATVILLRSRAVVLSMFVAAFAIILLGKGDIKLRITLGIVILVGLILLMNEAFYDYFVNTILFGGKDTDNLNDISSGRWEEWETFGVVLGDNWIFGTGSNKMESFILTVIAEAGVFMGGAMLLFVLNPIRYAFANLNRKNPFVLIFIVLGITYCFDGIFEALTPLGPGVKCFAYWMLFGIFYGMKGRTDNFAKTILLKERSTKWN